MDKTLIPRGNYCYTIKTVHPDGRIEINPCPYHKIDESRHYQESGYCEYLGKGDWEEGGTMLLWDMVKECGENND